MRTRYGLVALVTFLSLAADGAALSAKENVANFLDSLRRLEMHDVAILYLESLRGRSRLAEGMPTLAFEEGVANLAAARGTLDFPKRERHLDTARAKFREFLIAQPKHSRVPTARAHLGNILVEQAKVKLARSKQPSQAANKDRLIRESREYFEEAEREIKKACEELEKALAAFPKVIDRKSEYALYEEREEWRDSYMQCRLWQAALGWEASRAYEEKSPEWKAQLERAADEYEKIHERWRNYVAGFYSLREAARCRMELGQRKQAIAMCRQNLAIEGGDSGVVHEIKGSSLAVAMQCWRDPEEGNWKEAVQQGRAWIDLERGEWLETDVALAVRWELAQSLKIAAADATDVTQRRKLLQEARQHATLVASKSRSEHRSAAAKFLNQIGDVPLK